MGTWQNIERGTFRDSLSGIMQERFDINESPPIWRQQQRQIFKRDTSTETPVCFGSKTFCSDVIRPVMDNSTSAYSTLHSSPLIDTMGTTRTTTSPPADYQLNVQEQSMQPTRKSHSDPERHPHHAQAILAPQSRDCSSDGDFNGGGNVRGCSTAFAGDDEKSLQNLYARYVQVMYTNEANLQHTIGVQQRLFEQQLGERQQQLMRQLAAAPQPRKGAEKLIDCSGSREVCVDEYERFRDNNNDEQCIVGGHGGSDDPGSPPVETTEYVIKRRADGSRYITRRPLKQANLTRSRGRSSLRQCSVGPAADAVNTPAAGTAGARYSATTDDDAVSEVKLGRYWSREERKKQAEKSREYRRHREAVRLQKNNVVVETGPAAVPAKLTGDPTVTRHARERTGHDVTIEPNMQKALRHGGKKVLERFTTLQELMTHGARGRTCNPLLSVTTV